MAPAAAPLAALTVTFTVAAAAFAYTLNPAHSAASKAPAFSTALSKPASLSTAASRGALAAELLSLFGSGPGHHSVPDDEARELRSCFKFLVSSDGEVGDLKRELLVSSVNGVEEDDDVAIVRWPPQPVLELARIAVDSGGDPGALQRALDPTMLPVPDVEGLMKDKCQLTSTPYARRFASEDVNKYLAFLFELIVKRGHTVGFNVSLSRYDLFHGHIFLANRSGRLGILFHAREYPAYNKETFPYNLGYCQKGSTLPYDDSMNYRNILWLAPLPAYGSKSWISSGVLLILDARPDGIIYRKLLSEDVDVFRTLYEEDFGAHVADVNYLNVANAASAEKIFIC